MPKQVAELRIDRRFLAGAASAGSITLNGGGGGGIGLHALNDPAAHFGELDRIQAPWVATDISNAIASHSALPDVHHPRVTLASPSGLLLVGQQLAVDPDDGIDVVAGGVAVDVTDIIGVGLTEDDSNNIILGTPSQLTTATTNAVSGTTHTHSVVHTANAADFPSRLLSADSNAQLRLATLTTDTITAPGDLSIDPVGVVRFPNSQTIRSQAFSSSFPIGGFQINETAITGQSALTIGVIQADELYVRIFVADEVRVDRGEEFISKSFGIVSRPFTMPGAIAGTVRIYFENSPALAGAIFSANDWLVFRFINIDTGLLVTSIWGQVSSYIDEGNDEQSWLFTLRQGTVGLELKKGVLAVDFGQSGQGFIHSSVIDPAGSPYIKFRTWTGANPYTPANYTDRVHIGNLASVADPEGLFTPTGYGFYSDNAYLKGTMAVASGKVWITETGLNIDAESTSSTDWDDFATKLTFTTAPGAPTVANTVGQMWGTRYSDGGQTIQNLVIYNEIGDDAGANVGNIQLFARTDDLESWADITLRADETGQSSITLYAGDITGPGLINLFGGVRIDGHLLPISDNSADIGSPSKRIRQLHVGTLFAGVTSSLDTGHNHNDLYYTEGEVDDFLALHALASHTHAQYALTTYVNDQLALKSDVGHNHNGVYYTETEVDALLTGYAPASHTHNSIYYTETEINAKFTDLPGDGLTSTTVGGNVVLALNLSGSLSGLVIVSDTLRANLGTGLVLSSNAITLDMANLAGDGLEVASSKFKAKLGSGLQFNVTTRAIETTGEDWGDVSVVAGAGLTGGGSLSDGSITLAVSPGAGIEIVSDLVKVDSTVARSTWAVNPGAGLTGGGALAAAGITLTVELKTGGGIDVDGDGLFADNTVARSTWLVTAGDGLTGGGTLAAAGITLALNVSSTGGLQIVSDAAGIKLPANSGLGLSSNGLAMDTPATLTVSSTSALSGAVHSHAITSSANPGAAAAILATNSSGVLRLVRFGTNADPGTDTLHVQAAATSSVSVAIQAIASQTTNLFEVRNSGGTDLLVVDSAGNLQSANPGYVSGTSGWRIAPDGFAEFNNVVVRGEIRATVFARREIQVGTGTMLFTPAGRLKASLTVTNGGTVNMDIVDPPYEHVQQFFEGDILRIRSGGSHDYNQSAGPNVWGSHKFYMPSVPMTLALAAADVWLEVLSVTDMTDYYRYSVQHKSGTTTSFPSGTTVASYGDGTKGLIGIVADEQYAPYMEVIKPSATPWLPGGITPLIRMGRLDGIGLPELTTEQYGIVISTNASDSTAARIVASNTQFKLINIGFESFQGTRKTASIASSGLTQFGYDIANEQMAFSIDPSVDNGGRVWFGKDYDQNDGAYFVWEPTAPVLAYTHIARFGSMVRLDILSTTNLSGTMSIASITDPVTGDFTYGKFVLQNETGGLGPRSVIIGSPTGSSGINQITGAGWDGLASADRDAGWYLSAAGLRLDHPSAITPRLRVDSTGIVFKTPLSSETTTERNIRWTRSNAANPEINALLAVRLENGNDTRAIFDSYLFSNYALNPPASASAILRATDLTQTQSAYVQCVLEITASASYTRTVNLFGDSVQLLAATVLADGMVGMKPVTAAAVAAAAAANPDHNWLYFDAADGDFKVRYANGNADVIAQN